MFDELDLPQDLVERATMLEGILVDTATGGSGDGAAYERLRRDFMQRDELKGMLPAFVRSYRNLSAFWGWIKYEAGTYAERRKIISEAFTPLMDYLEGKAKAPSDTEMSDALETFDAEGVHVVWSKALSRRASDPEGAITIARTLLETVCKRILDEREVIYIDTEDLPKLYAMTAKALNLAPSQHSEEPIKAILGGAMTVVNGIGTLRNRLSDAHGRGGKLPVRPSSRHASLAVNIAGAVATFLVETHLA
ncbi:MULTISPECIES: abortive infection family protein [Rhizobium/Agrobacterium group]|uniref:Abortive phage resistance protein n=1 Tax=Rhizobium rhizogenes TaxID=359 RepID=A0A546XI05_RHIRH|nr:MULTISPECIES: abortive infection family protein [Rhizobium/Agrobacterium group]TRB00386.1 abortive phage resistance protein [Rhizobium rhizogenes]